MADNDIIDFYKKADSNQTPEEPLKEQTETPEPVVSEAVSVPVPESNDPFDKFLYNLAGKIQESKPIQKPVVQEEVKEEPVTQDEPFNKFLLELAEKLQKEKVITKQQQKTLAEEVDKPISTNPDEKDPFKKFIGSFANIIKQDELVNREENIKEATIDFINKLKEQPDDKPFIIDDELEVKPRNKKETEKLKQEPELIEDEEPVVEEQTDSVETEQPAEGNNSYVKELKQADKNKKTKKEDKQSSSIKSIVEKQVAQILSRYPNLGFTGGGGGTNAVQYAEGGTMNGDLTVNGTINASVYLSAGQPLSVGGGGGGGNQTLSYNETSALLSISNGNTVSLSSLSGGNTDIGTVLSYLSTSYIQVSGLTVVENLSVGGTLFTSATALVLDTYSQIIGNNVDSEFTITHNFDTTDVTVTVYNTTTNVQVFAKVNIIDSNSIKVSFDYPPNINQFKVLIFGSVPSNRVSAYTVVGGGGTGSVGITSVNNFTERDVTINNYIYTTVSQNVSSNRKYGFDTTLGPLTATLPPNPQLGDEIEFFDACGRWFLNSLTIDNNAKYIEQLNDKLLCNVKFGIFKLIYTGTIAGWRIVPLPKHDIPSFVEPIVSISSTIDLGYDPITVGFIGISNLAPTLGPVDNWYWNLTGGSQPDFFTQAVTYTYSTSGIYTVTLTGSNFVGIGTATKTITALPVLVPIPTITANALISAIPFTISLNGNNTLPVSSSPVTNWYWNLTGGDDAQFTTQNVTFTYNTSGIYVVTLSAENASGIGTASITVTALQPLVPVPVISASAFTGNTPFTVTLTGFNTLPLSLSPVDNWYWNLTGGDEAQFTTRVTTFTYTSAGVYTANLTASNITGFGTATTTITATESLIPSNYLAFWKLADLTDSSPNGNNLVNTNNVQFVAGKIGDCAQFPGNNSTYLQNNSLSSPFNPNGPSGEFTISCWINPASFSNYQAFLGSTSPGFIIHTDSGGNLYCNEATAGDAQINSILQLNQWQHIIFVKSVASGNRTKVWYNGTKVYDQPTNNISNYQSKTNVTLGNLGGLSYPYNGKLDMVGLWNRELTQSEIDLLYNNGNGREP